LFISFSAPTIVYIPALPIILIKDFRIIYQAKVVLTPVLTNL
jgi:hypothetical protein